MTKKAPSTISVGEQNKELLEQLEIKLEALTGYNVSRQQLLQFALEAGIKAAVK